MTQILNIERFTIYKANWWVNLYRRSSAKTLYTEIFIMWLVSDCSFAVPPLCINIWYQTKSVTCYCRNIATLHTSNKPISDRFGYSINLLHWNAFPIISNKILELFLKMILKTRKLKTRQPVRGFSRCSTLTFSRKTHQPGKGVDFRFMSNPACFPVVSTWSQDKLDSTGTFSLLQQFHTYKLPKKNKTQAVILSSRS